MKKIIRGVWCNPWYERIVYLLFFFLSFSFVFLFRCVELVRFSLFVLFSPLFSSFILSFFRICFCKFRSPFTLIISSSCFLEDQWEHPPNPVIFSRTRRNAQKFKLQTCPAARGPGAWPDRGLRPFSAVLGRFWMSRVFSGVLVVYQRRNRENKRYHNHPSSEDDYTAGGIIAVKHRSCSPSYLPFDLIVFRCRTTFSNFRYHTTFSNLCLDARHTVFVMSTQSTGVWHVDLVRWKSTLDHPNATTLPKS